MLKLKQSYTKKYCVYFKNYICECGFCFYALVKVEKRINDEGLSDRSGYPFFIVVLGLSKDRQEKKIGTDSRTKCLIIYQCQKPQILNIKNKI